MPRAGLAERPFAPHLLIAAAVLAAYLNALPASFQFDDWNVVVGDPRVHSLPAWWASLPGIRPLLKLSYALNAACGPAAAGYHAVNVAIHAAAACLAFAVLARGGRRPVALAAALIFALHPVQTEAVTYVSGRSTSLAGLLCLGSLLAWQSLRGRAGLLSAALFAAALLVKETSAVLPLALVLADRAVGVRPRWPLPHLGVLGAGVLLALASPTYRHLAEVSLGARGPGTNLRTQAHAVVYLAGQLVRPDRLNADPDLPVLAGWSPGLAMEAAALLSVLALGFALLPRRPAAAFGILWFFLWLLPTNSLLPRLDVANDRQVYLAALGPAWLAALALAAWGGRKAVAATAVLALALGAATHARNRVYRDEIAFWSDVVRKSPGKARAFNNLGYALALAGREREAEAAFRHALVLDRQDVRAAVNLRLLRQGALRQR